MTEAPPEIPPNASADTFETTPLSRAEYINAMIQFYRGERSRAEAWRQRLDSTTNWAVVTAGGMLSFAFGQKEHSHVALLLAQLLVMIFLGIEARRFRYFDVWRARVRMIEENFFIPILRRDLISPRRDWREAVSRDLDTPSFKMTLVEALALRLRFNYIWIFLVLFLAWLAKLNLHPAPAAGLRELVARMGIGPVAGPYVLVVAIGANLLAIWAALRGGGGFYDEVHGLDPDRAHWRS
jgi:uncharacterized membrane protein